MNKQKQIYTLCYTTKSTKGFIVDKERKFKSFNKAREFACELKESGKLVGKPVVQLGG